MAGVSILLVTLPLLPLQNIIFKIDNLLPRLPGINFTNLLVLYLLVRWLRNTIGKGRPLVAPSGLNRVIAAWFVVTYIGLWRSSFYLGMAMPLSPTDEHFIFWKDFMSSFLIFFVVGATIPDEKAMKRLTLAMIAVLPYMVYVHHDHLQSVDSWHFDDDLRVKGTMMHLGSNELAAFYVVGLMVMSGLLMHAWGLRDRLAYGAAATLFGWGVIFSYSRSTYIAAIGGAAVIGIFKSRKLFLVLLLFFLASPFIIPASVEDRFNMISGEQVNTDESTQRRMELWSFAVEKFEENPVIGTGLHSFLHINRHQMDTHNMFLKVLCELGIVGFALLLLIFLMGFREAARLSREATSPFLRGLSVGVMGSILAAIVVNVFGDRFSYLSVVGFWWIWQGMVVRGRVIEEERRRAAAAEGGPPGPPWPAGPPRAGWEGAAGRAERGIG